MDRAVIDDSIAARYIQPADPLYQVQPPRPTWGGSFGVPVEISLALVAG